MKTIYEYRKRVTRDQQGSTHTQPILLEYAWSMAGAWLAVPVRSLRTASPQPTDREFAPYGLFRTLLILFVLLVMGVGDVQGQPDNGVYFITNNSTKNLPEGAEKWYLWPSVTINADTGNPYVTTFYAPSAPALDKNAEGNTNHVEYEAHDETYSHWVVKNVDGVDGAFQIINPRLGRYIVKRDKEDGGMDVWLMENPTGGDLTRSYFYLYKDDTGPYRITYNKNTNKTFNSATEDKPYLCSTNNDLLPQNTEYRAGLIQFYKDTPLWTFTTHLLAAPKISKVNQETNKVTITENNSLPPGYIIHYTFSAEGEPEDPTATTSTVITNGEYQVTVAGTLKVVVERYGIVLTEVAKKYVEPHRCATPVITYSTETRKLTITSETPDATIYYTFDGTTPTSSSGSIPNGESIDVTDEKTVTVNAIATNTESYFRDSEMASVTLVLNPTIVLAEAEYTYDGSAKEPEVSFVKAGEATIDDTEYTVDYEDNTKAGTATVKIIDNSGGSYIVYGSTTFTINKADITPSVTVADWTYGGEASTPVVSGNLDNGTVAYEYKVLGAADKTYTETVPTNAGNYTIRATIAATNNCNAGTATADFTIIKAELTPTVTIDGWIYGTAAKKPSVTGNTENGTVTYEYKIKDAEDETYTTTIPANAGSYTIRATIAETTNYNRKQVTTDFIISKADINPTITMEGWTYGETANTPSVTGNTGNGTVTYEYKVKDADDNTYTTTVPIIAGNYTIRATITATANYSGKQVTKDFTISRATITPIVTIANWTYGDVANAPTVTGNTENGTVTYEYKLKDAADNTYTTTVPTDAGHYTLRAAIAGTTNYKGNYATTNFSINKATFTPTVSMTGWTYGDDANAPEVTGNTSSGAVTYEYKLTSAADATYTTKVPKDAGSYTVRATIAETANYNGAVATATFTIGSKAINTGDAPKAGMTVDFRKNSSGQYVTVLKDNGTTLEEGAAYDYTVTKTETSKYITATITGADHNYTGSFTIKFAKVNFTKKEGSGTPGGVGTFVTNATGDGDFVTPANMTAYIVTGISGNSALTEKVDYICEDMPVLLLSTVDADGFIVQLETDVDVLYSDEEKSERVGKNKLEKKSTDWTLTKSEIYLLYKGEFVLNAPGTLEAGKIYLPMPSNASPSPRLAIAWGDVTAIEDGRWKMEDGRSEYWYTLDGRRINGKPTTKGLYIVNGKKKVVK